MPVPQEILDAVSWEKEYPPPLGSNPLFAQFCAEIDRDYAILSADARDRMKSMLAALARDAFDRGREKE